MAVGLMTGTKTKHQGKQHTIMVIIIIIISDKHDDDEDNKIIME